VALLAVALIVPALSWAVAQEKGKEAPPVDTIGVDFFKQTAALVPEAEAVDKECDEAIASARARLTEALSGVKDLAKTAKDPKAGQDQLDSTLKKAFDVLFAAESSLTVVQTKAGKHQSLAQRLLKLLEAHKTVLAPKTYEELRDSLLAVAVRLANADARLGELGVGIRNAQKVVISRKPDLLARLVVAILDGSTKKIEAFVNAAESLVSEILETLGSDKSGVSEASPKTSVEVVNPR
jgi:hypothetical protein